MGGAAQRNLGFVVLRPSGKQSFQLGRPNLNSEREAESLDWTRPVVWLCPSEATNCEVSGTRRTQSSRCGGGFCAYLDLEHTGIS